MANKIYFIDDILKVLPHRYPFVLIDRMEVIESGVNGAIGRFYYCNGR